MKADALEHLAPPPPSFGPNIALARVETVSDLWGTSPSSSTDESAVADRPSRQFPVSSFSTIRGDRTLDYWEFHRILDSIEARLATLKRDAGLTT
jgi:hypothetical protein